MENLLQTALLGIGSVGGIGAVVAGLVKFFGERWAQHLHEQWKHELQRDLEDFRSELKNQHEVLSHALASGSAGFMAAQEQRLEAVQAIWKQVLEIRQRYGQSHMVWNVMTEDELAELHDFTGDFFVNVPKTVDELIARYPVDPIAPEIHRPFVGEQFWLLFFIYRAVAGRLAFRVADGIENGRIPPWDKDLAGSDDAVVQLLDNVFSPDEMEFIRAQDIGGLHLVFQLLENKMLAEAEAKLSGSQAVETWMGEGKRALEMLREVNEATKSTRLGP